MAAGEPVEENHTCWGLTISAQICHELRKQGFPVSMCFCPWASAAHWLVVAVNQSYRSGLGRDALARELGHALFRSRCGSFIPKVILLDDDVDATSLDEVVWAFATRTHPERDQLLFPAEGVLPLVAFLNHDERQQARGTKVIYNGLAADERTARELACRSSFRHLWPREIQDKVVRDSGRYGYQ